MPTLSGPDFKQRLSSVLGYARLAPSVHNIQPWRLESDNQELRLFIPPERHLKYGDPTGRQTWLSLGCLVENMVLACRHVGLQIESKYNFDATLHEAVAWFRLSAHTARPIPDLMQAITQRYSDRSPYLNQRIPESDLGQIQKSWKSDNVNVHTTADPDILETLANLTGRGITMALGMPQFRQELSQLIHNNWSGHEFGLHGYALELSGLRSMLEKPLVRHGLNIKKQANKESSMMRASAGLVFVTSRGDIPRFWLESGQAYQRAALEAWRLGLHQSTSAAVVEAADFHLDVEKLLNTTFRLQTIMRIGYSPRHRRATPRLPLAKIATST